MRGACAGGPVPGYRLPHRRPGAPIAANRRDDAWRLCWRPQSFAQAAPRAAGGRRSFLHRFLFPAPIVARLPIWPFLIYTLRLHRTDPQERDVAHEILMRASALDHHYRATPDDIILMS